MVVAAGLVLLLPSVLAATGSGTLITEGPIHLPPHATIEGEPLAAFTEDAPNLARLVLTSPKVRLREYALTYTVTGTDTSPVRIANPPQVRESNLTAARFELVGKDDVGWLGIYPAQDGSHASFAAPVPAVVTPEDNARIGNSREEGALSAAYDKLLDEGRPGNPRYHRAVTSPHLLLQSPGTAVFTGEGILKILGADLLLSSNEREGIVSTGISSREGTFREETYRWIILNYDQATLQIETQGPLALALEEGTATWSGPATFASAHGEIHTDFGTYAPDGGRTLLDGDLVAHLVPSLEADRVVAYARLQGDLASTNLAPQGAASAPAPASGGFAWMAAGALLVVAAGGAGAAVLVRKRRARPRARVAVVDVVPVDDGLQADDCIRFADEAAVERRWARALHWARRAREMAPTNARIRADEGEYLFQLGLFEEAMQAFGEASRLDAEEGYADYRAAQAAAAAGRPVDEVLAWLSQALEKSPDLVGDLELFKEFEALRGMDGYDAMVRRAYDRLGIDPAHAF